MSNIELVIKIPEGLKKDFELEQWTALSCMEMKNALEKATPLPKGHGKLIDENDFEKRIAILTHSMDLGYGEIMDVIDEISPIIKADKEE